MPLAIGWRTPLFASWRYIALASAHHPAVDFDRIRILDAGQNAEGIACCARAGSVSFLFATILFGAVAFGATAMLEGQFLYKRHAVLSADTHELGKARPAICLSDTAILRCCMR